MTQKESPKQSPAQKKAKAKIDAERDALNLNRALRFLAADDAQELSALISEWPQWEKASVPGENEIERLSLLMKAMPGSPQCVDLLIERASHAMPPRSEDFDLSPILAAIEANRADWFERLIPKTDLTAMNYTGRTTLTRAATSKNPAFIEALARAGQNLDERDGKGANALQMANVNGCPLTVRALLALGANVHDVDEAGHDTLMRAARQGTLECIRELLPYSDFSRRAIPLGSKDRFKKNALGIVVEPLRKNLNSERGWAVADAIACEMLRRGVRKPERLEIEDAMALGGPQRMPATHAQKEAQELAQAAGMSAARAKSTGKDETSGQQPSPKRSARRM